MKEPAPQYPAPDNAAVAVVVLSRSQDNVEAINATLRKAGHAARCTWLPDAGVAPSPVTALLHAAVLVKIGVYAYARLFVVNMPMPEVWHTVVPVMQGFSARKTQVSATRSGCKGACSTFTRLLRSKFSAVCGPLWNIRPGATPQTRKAGASACACSATLRSSASLDTV